MPKIKHKMSSNYLPKEIKKKRLDDLSYILATHIAIGNGGQLVLNRDRHHFLADGVNRHNYTVLL